MTSWHFLQCFDEITLLPVVYWVIFSDEFEVHGHWVNDVINVRPWRPHGNSYFLMICSVEDKVISLMMKGILLIVIRNIVHDYDIDYALTIYDYKYAFSFFL